MTPLERVTERVWRNGDPNDPKVPRPMLTLAEFFEGNDVSGCIWCNLADPPTTREIYMLLSTMRGRAGVHDVRVEIAMFDDPAWPFSERIWIVTGSSPEVVRSWFDPELAPDECGAGFDDQPREPIPVPPGMSPVWCWWD